MKKYYLILIFACAVLLSFGCVKETPKYEIHIDGKTIRLPIREDNNLVRKDIRQVFKPYWDNLHVGVSPEFYYKRVSPEPLNLDEKFIKKAKPKGVSEISVTSSKTVTSAKFRFFKRQDGKKGIEQMGKTKNIEAIIGEGINWKDIEDYMCNEILYHYNKTF